MATSCVMPPLLILAALYLPATRAHADDGDAIVTDRPDFVESSDVVGRGRLQVETGVSHERSRMLGVRERSLATPTLLRIGLRDDWELRLESDGRTVLKTQDEPGAPTRRQTGYADVSLGIKWHMQDGAGTRPSVGWLLHADIDSGSAAFRGNGVRPSLRMAAEWDLPGGYSLGVMPGVALDRTAAGERHAVGIFGAVLGKAWTERWRGFVELAAPQLARAKYGGSLVTYDIGTTYLLTPRLQIDAIVQVGANRNSADLGMGLGLSAKF